MEKIDVIRYQTVHIGKHYNASILREQRVTKKMTQKQVAEKADITLQQYQKFESGERNIMTASFQLACRVIEALGMSPTEFFHHEYVIGEEVYIDDGVEKYVKTGRPTNEDIT